MVSRWTSLFAATTVAGFATSAVLLWERRGAADCPIVSAAAPSTTAAVQPPDPWVAQASVVAGDTKATLSRPTPQLPEPKEESRMDRRARRTIEIAAMLGRDKDETEEAYRARIAPLITAGLASQREKALEMRKVAEEKAHVTPAQSAALDKQFEKTYADVLDYTNKAIADGTLSPYERNVAGWLEMAGGLGSMLGETQQQIGKILDAGQMKTMYDAGFEWGEYLGVSAPWEKLSAPPAR